MNQTQRNFLIKKVSETADSKIKALKETLPKLPSLNNWLLHAVLSGEFNIKSIPELKETIRQYALNANDREDWLGNSWNTVTKTDVHFKAENFFIIPDEYTIKKERYESEEKIIQDKIYQLKIQKDTLITRIQLASDKLLQKMINEVDDMGDISLIDTKLKMLNN